MRFLLLALATLSFTNAQSDLQQQTDYTSDEQFQADILNSTNFYRAQHNASNLAWNDTLATYAANYMKGCNFQHSGGPYGENLAAGYPNAIASVEAWGNEGKDYDFSAGQFTENTGHFTQLVWKATTTTGCGRANCSGENGTPGWYVVCEYWPRGNLIGNFTQNVQQGSASSGSGRSLSATESILTVGIGLAVVCIAVFGF